MSYSLTPEQIGKLIGIKVKDWPGNCYSVAVNIVESGLVEGRPEYGIWQGEIAPGSYFDDRPIARHGWVRLPDGQVLDPTRWVFEGVDPYIYIGSGDDYDFGAADLRARVLGTQSVSESEVLDFLDNPEDFADERQFLHKLANTPPKAHPFLMAEVYETIDRMGCGALIPIDYQEWAGI
jgi:hypothetical protein